MADNKIGGLPVLHDGEVTGIITETDLFKIFLELMGARNAGIRATILLHEVPGKLAKLTQAIASAGGNFVAFGVFQGETASNRVLTFKVEGMDLEQVRSVIEPIAEGIIDLRDCCP
jgi:acetoin utilization protein AcuB